MRRGKQVQVKRIVFFKPDEDGQLTIWKKDVDGTITYFRLYPEELEDLAVKARKENERLKTWNIL